MEGVDSFLVGDFKNVVCFLLVSTISTASVKETN